LTLPDDYVGEMIALHQIDDVTAEALLAGRAVDDDLRPLAEVVQAYRRMARQPERPSPALAGQIAAGVFIGPAESYQVPAAARGHRRQSRSFIRTAWIAVPGGVVAAVAGVGAAGFAGVLPEQAQDQFESVVETVTPYEFPPHANENAEPGDACEPGQPICGEEVSEDATDGGVDGGEVSERARNQGDYRRPVDPPTEPGVPPDVAPADPKPPVDPGPDNIPTPPTDGRRPTAPPGR
jgi:hypothetical protein